MALALLALLLPAALRSSQSSSSQLPVLCAPTTAGAINTLVATGFGAAAAPLFLQNGGGLAMLAGAQMLRQPVH
jgi:hypothetical protein